MTMVHTDDGLTQMDDADLFRTVAGHWPTGVAVVTTIDGDEQPYGLTANAVTCLSADPLQYLVCVDNQASALPAMLESRLFCLNFLAEGQEDIARVFACGQACKFGAFDWTRLPNALPLITGSVAQIGCEIATVHEGGDHRIVVGTVNHLGITGGDPLMYYRGGFRRIG
jgi:3-hydroxy-9,10-secoandrosta-1,3,5(10)-triene-9,17-dione monooxygenase reductase component